MFPGKILLLLLSLALLAGCKPTVYTLSGSRSGGLSVRVKTAYPNQILEDSVAQVSLTLTGPGFPVTPPIEVTRSQFVNNVATVHWDNLLPGKVHLTATAYDGSERVLAKAEGDAEIREIQTSEMTFTVTPMAGPPGFSLSLGDLGEATASVSVSLGSVPRHSWQPAPSLAIARACTTAVVLDGVAYVLGGDYNTEIESLAPAKGVWTPRLIANNPRILHLIGQAGVLRNRILLVGRDVEYSNLPMWAAPVLFDPLTMNVQVMAFPSLSSSAGYFNIQYPRTAVGVGSDGENLYMVGGTSKVSDFHTDYVFLTLPTVEVLNAKSETWQLCTPMPTSRGALGVAMLNGKLYAAGGFKWNGTAANDFANDLPAVQANGASMEALNNLEVYDPVPDKWTTCSAMPTPRHSLSLVVAQGRLYAIGGKATDGRVLSTVESYDPVTDSWRSEPAIPTARAMHAAVNLDGLIYAIGGTGTDGRPLRSVEVFNPEGL